MKNAVVDAVIVAYRSADLLSQCIEALQASGLGGKIVVVEQSGEHHQPHPGVEVLERTNLGFGSGVNAGMAATSTAYVLVVNPDALVTPSFEVGAALLDGNPDVAAVQGVIVGAESGLPERSAGRLLGPIHLWGRALGLRRLLASGAVRRLAGRATILRDHIERVPGQQSDVQWLAATAILLRRTAFDDVGGFDDRYFLYGEDLDFCRRLTSHGWRLVSLPDTWAAHASGASSPTTVDRELRWWSGTLRYAAQWWGRPGFAVGYLAGLVAGVRVYVSSVDRHREVHDVYVVEPLRARRQLRSRF